MSVQSVGTGTTSPPVYKRREIPEDLRHLRTVTELKQDRLKPGEGQSPTALLRVYRRGHGWGEFPLYDPAGAAPMRALSAKQQAARDARHTCPQCRVIRPYVVHGRCGDCVEAALAARRELESRTCYSCRRVSGAPLPFGGLGSRACDPCRIRTALLLHAWAERERAFQRTCLAPSCTTIIATDEEIAAAREAGTWRGPWRCPPCAQAWEIAERQRRVQAAEKERMQREARARQVQDLVRWAEEVFADDLVVVLDTETTGLEDDARIVDIAITDRNGTPILDTLIDPQCPIPTAATDIHGITDSMVTGAPTFGQILERLTEALDGRRCLIYNAPFDKGRLRHELSRHHQAAGHPDPRQAAADWMDAHVFQDAMTRYSDWYGDWSEYRQDYTWQRLYGGDHRALSDCRAVLARLREMSLGHEPDVLAS